MSAPETASIERQSMRGYLGELERAGELLRVSRRVDVVYEISAFLGELRCGRAVLFEDTGTSIPVVGNVLNSRRRIGHAIGVKVEAIEARIMRAIDNPVQPIVVGTAPWQEISIDNPDLIKLPVPTFFEYETGPYITGGLIVAKDPVTGRCNVSIARLKLLGGNRAFIGVAPNHHLSVLAQKAHARGEKLEVAVTIGNHAAVILASNLYLQLGDDEYEVAGELLGEPLLLARCRRVALEVAAACEIVLEGTIDQSETVEEGPVSEYHGMYVRYKRGPVVTFHHLSRRHDAMFQAVQPGFHPEHLLIGAVGIGATTGRAVGAVVPSFERLIVTEAGCGRFSAIIVLREPLPGDAKKAMFAAWASVNLLKNLVVVDADIDPLDPVQVDWAINTRTRFERDLVVVPGVRADRSDPMAVEGLIAKLGIDATETAGDREDWTIAAPPRQVLERVRAELREQTIR